MTQVGVVINTVNNRAEVKIKRQSSCGENCAMCNACNEADRSLWVINEIGAKPSDKVKIELSTKKVIFLAFLTYIMPLLLFLVATIITKSIFILTAVLILSFVIFSFISNALAKTYNFGSKITKIIQSENIA